ncbi:hypothetical protein NHF48_022125 [Sphingomonas sp. H160509]|uniref:hypothetical protein n=1 Tax=Sphingomonas sp. H160509 TaxID=2955313 RepID=UPI002097154A|nr:hypothetical protein [Sphingomonas sp. H160509]MDD1453003.1 hypothetical protein [Sphingomonas sp. H160509]
MIQRAERGGEGVGYVGRLHGKGEERVDPWPLAPCKRHDPVLDRRLPEAIGEQGKEDRTHVGVDRQQMVVMQQSHIDLAGVDGDFDQGQLR